MVDLPKIVLVISKSLIRAAKIEGNELQDPIEMEWRPELLRKAFAVIKERYTTARIRVVLDEDMSHTVDLEIPIVSVETEERQAVEAKIREQIPEVLTAGNWDYKIKEVKDASKVVTVFVPVQENFIAVSEAAAKEGLEIEAVEPISVSLTRSTDPFIGMAMKTDLRGDDRDILNIQPVFAPQEESGSLTNTPQIEQAATVTPATATPSLTSPSSKKGLMIGMGVLLFVLLAGGIFAATKTSLFKAAPSPSPSPIAVTPSVMPSPTPEPVDIADLKLQVLNGSGVPGQAGVVATKLEAAGFGKAETGNADNYKYTNTIVQLKSTVPVSVVATITQALQPAFTVKQGDPLKSDSEFDVVVIVGTNKSLPSPTPRPSVSPSTSPRPSGSASPSPSASGSPRPSGSASPSPSASVGASSSPSPSASAH